jgi:hypothetical protein
MMGMSYKMKSVILLMILSLSTWASAQYHVTATGTSEGDGSIDSPWDLSTALTATETVVGGDTVFVHGGTYVGCFDCNISGSPGANVVVLPYNKETVILDGNDTSLSGPHEIINVLGDHVTIRDFIFTNSNPNRYEPTLITSAIYVHGDYVSIINNIIHDNCGNAIGLWADASETICHGNIVFYAGWIKTNSSTGYGMYLQGEIGEKYISNNVIVKGSAVGVHAYGEGGAVTGLNFKDNVFINNSAIGSDDGIPNGYNFFIGQESRPPDKITLDGNVFYTDGIVTGNVKMGYAGVGGEILRFTNNYIVGGNQLIEFSPWIHLDVLSNTFIDGLDYFFIVRMKNEYTDVESNEYYGAQASDVPFYNVDQQQQFAEWQASGFDLNGSLSIDYPSNNVIKIIKNDYEYGRAQISVFNYKQLNSVEVDLSSVLAMGDSYYIYDVENLFAAPVASGTYMGAGVDIPVDQTSVAIPLGVGSPGFTVPEHTDILFGSYLLICHSI